MTKFISWAEGDPSSGEGTFSANLQLEGVDLAGEDLSSARAIFRRAFSELWDVPERSVSIVTEGEYIDMCAVPGEEGVSE